jgi:hypothetical protein
MTLTATELCEIFLDTGHWDVPEILIYKLLRVNDRTRDDIGVCMVEDRI